MDTAFCSQDGNIYTALNFSKLEDLAIKRRFLSCENCKHPAFFRKKTRHGRKACFGADHLSTCPLRTSNQREEEQAEAAIEVQKILKSENTIDLVLEPLRSPQKQSHPPKIRDSREEYIAREYTLNPPREETSHYKLTTLLKFLTRTADFAQSNVQIRTSPDRQWRAKNLFVHFTSISAAHVDKWRAYWGMISDANIGKPYFWLNTGGKDAVSIKLSPKLKPLLMNRFAIPDIESFAGTHALVFGYLNRSASRKLIITPTGEEWLCLRNYTDS